MISGGRPDSNRRRHEPQSRALPTELRPPCDGIRLPRGELGMAQGEHWRGLGPQRSARRRVVKLDVPTATSSTGPSSASVAARPRRPQAAARARVSRPAARTRSRAGERSRSCGRLRSRIPVVPRPEVIIAPMCTDETAVGQQLDAFDGCEVLTRRIGPVALVRFRCVELPIHVEMKASTCPIVTPEAGAPLRVAAPAHRWISRTS